MRIVMLCTLIALLTAINSVKEESRGVEAGSQVPGKIAGGFRLSVAVDKEVFKSTEQVVLTLTLKNVTKKVLLLVDTRPERDFKVIIKNQNGTELHPKSTNSGMDDVRREVLKVKPGTTIRETLVLNNLYDLTTGGTYFVIVSRNVLKLRGEGFDSVVGETTTIRIGG